MTLGLDGKRAIVTGGSRGIGRAAVLALAGAGAAVATCYHRESDDVEALRKELAGVGDDSYCAQADLSDADDARRFVREAVERFGRIDVLVNNAGVVSHRMLGDLDLEEWHRIIDTNLTAVYLVVQTALDAIPEGGSVINITSAVAMRGMPARVHYGSSKAGVIGMTRALCKELGARGIRVNAVAPGIIRTDIHIASGDPARVERIGPSAPLQRAGEAEEVARAIVWLLSEEASYMTGALVDVTGGR